MSDSNELPLLKSARREAVGALLIWLLVTRSATAALRLGGGVFLVAAITIAGVQWRDQRSSDYREWTRQSQQTATVDRTSLLRWLGDDTPDKSVVASISDILTSEVRRREAVAAPTMGYPFPPYREERIEALRRMYAEPDCDEVQRQATRGVTHAVATAEEAAVGALDACATRVYENPSYVVYELAKAP